MRPTFPLWSSILTVSVSPLHHSKCAEHSEKKHFTVMHWMLQHSASVWLAHPVWLLTVLLCETHPELGPHPGWMLSLTQHNQRPQSSSQGALEFLQVYHNASLWGPLPVAVLHRLHLTFSSNIIYDARQCALLHLPKSANQSDPIWGHSIKISL